ncbi:hypothetical protein RF11_03286 [Thelohanellus kitauei]|uniref:UspA domain-containing protein n=1 Tax=Thelohanellus kitauei TaxID=669202 RepID=A0A0C2MW94_THEKT|nr:hypothetical protein RF11_03286 [Thelohanellus kitauei]
MKPVIVVGLDTSDYAEQVIEYVVKYIYRPGHHIIALAHFLGTKHIGSHYIWNHVEIDCRTFCPKGKKKLEDSLAKLENIEKMLNENKVRYIRYFESGSKKKEDYLWDIAREIGAQCIVVGISHLSMLKDLRSHRGYDLSAKSGIPVFIVK